MRQLASVIGGAVIAAAVAWSHPAAAAEDVPVRFTLDWIIQAPHAAFFRALQEGYYAEEGLDVTFDPGKGSADAVQRIVSGAYDMGYPDINALIEFNAQNPDSAVPVVMIGYEQPPFSIFTLKGSGIEEPEDLVGKTLGAPVFDASYKLFPAFAARIGIDPADVPRKNMDPQLREAMLVRGEVDAISGHVFSSMLDIKSKGVSEDEIVYFMYGDHGMDFYGNGIAASPEFLREHPEAVRGFIRATIRAWKDILGDPELAIAALKEAEPLLKEDVERERLELALECCILTEAVLRDGFGGADMERLARAIDQVALAFGLERKPTPEEMFDPSFLPPKEERMLR